MWIAEHRTKNLLSNVLLTLLSQQNKAFESITINDLCALAKIHRTTFYTHFEDKFDLFQYTYRSLSIKRTKYPLPQRLLRPFEVSEQLLQTNALRTANELHQHTSSLKQLVEQLSFEAVSFDLQQLKQTHCFQLPEKIIVQHLCATLFTMDSFWKNEGTHYNVSEIDYMYQQLIEPLISPQMLNMS